jgi:hypothetical protein
MKLFCEQIKVVVVNFAKQRDATYKLLFSKGNQVALQMPLYFPLPHRNQ